MRLQLPASLALVLLSARLSQCFYLPGITPTNYKINDRVELNANKLTPSQSERDTQTRSVFSFDYYYPAFHFCPPENGAEYISESLGSILFGDRIMTTPYELHLGKNETCKAVCDEQTLEPRDAKFVNKRIWQNYNLNWLVDGLPAGQPYLDPTTNTEYYQPGFALGEIKDEVPQLNNHYDIYIDYHQSSADQYRVVGILVEPSSSAGSRRTGSGDDFSADGCDSGKPVILSEKGDNKVTYTYSVYWRPSKTSFATRWDKYLHVYDSKIHWFSLINSAVIVMFLIGMVGTVLGRTLRKDIARYNRLDQLGLDDLNGTSVEDGIQEDSGWKLVHGDVFRSPKNPLLLAVLVGNGAQLFMMAGFTIAFAVVGFLSPSNRGSLTTVMILLYTVFGFVGGYASSRVYKSFRGEKWKQLFVYTPSAMPALVFGTFFLLNLLVWARQSSGAVPFTTMLVIVGIWFVISVPLSILGSWFGFRQPQADPPVRTNQIPRQIPQSSGYLRPLPSMLLVGVLPFGAIFVELYFIMSSLWSSRIYYMFGFLFLCYGLMIVTSAACAILMIYFVLCAENYHWQWRAFGASGASAGYVFAYSLLYWARMLSFSSWTGGMLYLGYSALLSFMWFVLSGKFAIRVTSVITCMKLIIKSRNHRLRGLLDICAPYLRLAQGRLETCFNNLLANLTGRSCRIMILRYLDVLNCPLRAGSCLLQSSPTTDR
jgi:transmembrane 9 superfamily protein 2/4